MKSTHWVTNFALLLIVTGLSYYAYNASKNKIINETIAPLTELKNENIKSISINKRGSYTILQKRNNIWRLTKPISIKANQFRVGSLLKLLSTNKYTRYSTDNLNLEKYGFTESNLSLHIDDITVYFGNTNPVNGKRYILINNSMYLIDDNFYPLINSQIGTLIDQKLFENDSVITHLQTAEFTLDKDIKNIWKSTNDFSSDDIATIIHHWENAQAFGIHTYANHPALDTIEIKLSNSDTAVKFTVTDKEPWLIIARPEMNIEYHFDKSMIAKLFSDQQDIAATSNLP